MKYNNTVEILKSVMKAIEDPMYIANKLKQSEMFQFPSNVASNKSMNNNIYAEPEDDHIEYNKNAPMENSKSYNYDESNGYNNKKDTSSNSQGVIDSIAQELTSARLKQAIILSEIVGKPRSKTRKKRRF